MDHSKPACDQELHLPKLLLDKQPDQAQAACGACRLGGVGVELKMKLEWGGLSGSYSCVRMGWVTSQADAVADLLRQAVVGCC